ncbi:MAG: gamma-glutamyltransferase family protein [Pirellulaceae bacterium]
MKLRELTLGIWLVLAAALPCFAADEWHAVSRQGVVAAGRETSVEAGMAMLRQGGNAIDAAVATVLVQTVVESRSVCLGGEVPFLIYDAKRGKVEVLSGMGAAPQLATAAWFQEHKQGKIPRDDAAGAAVPSLLHVCLTALDRYGTLRVRDVTAPLLRSIDHDEPRWYADLSRHLRAALEAEQKEADRSAGIRTVIDYFYRGPAARAIDAWSREQGGLIRYEDLARHETRVEEPISIAYRGYTIYKCGAWTQGPMLLQTLRLLEHRQVSAMQHNSADYVHVVTEAMKLALADRDTYYADPKFVQVPLAELLSDSYTRLRLPLIDDRQASLDLRPGDPRHGRALLEVAPRDYRQPDATARDTTTCVTADQWGNVVAATPSGWSGVTAGNSGIVLGSRLISFNLWAGHPNCIAPGKRPRITLTPTLVCRDGKPVLAISVAGGDLQDQTTLQVLLNALDFQMDPAQAVTAPRFSTAHHVGSFNQTSPEPGSLSIYSAVGGDVIGKLKARGHTVKEVKGPIGHPVLIQLESSHSEKRVAGDPVARRHVGAL